jgi:hypothetical protein
MPMAGLEPEIPDQCRAVAPTLYALVTNYFQPFSRDDPSGARFNRARRQAPRSVATFRP